MQSEKWCLFFCLLEKEVSSGNKLSLVVRGGSKHVWLGAAINRSHSMNKHEERANECKRLTENDETDQVCISLRETLSFPPQFNYFLICP